MRSRRSLDEGGSHVPRAPFILLTFPSFLLSPPWARAKADSSSLILPSTFLRFLLFSPLHGSKRCATMLALTDSADREQLEADNVLGPIYKAFGELFWKLMEELNLKLAT